MGSNAGETLFVVVVSIVTAVVTAGFSILFAVNFSIKEDSQRNLWTIALCAVTYFHILYTMAFLTVDILDTQLCSTASDVTLQIPGTSSGCHIPAQTLWHILNFSTFFMGQFGLVFIGVLLRNKMRPRLQRVGLAMAAAVISGGGFIVLAIIFYSIPGSISKTYTSTALISSSVAFSVNDTIPSCAVPANIETYYSCGIWNTSLPCNGTLTQDSQTCSSFADNWAAPVRAFPSAFGFAQFLLTMYGVFGYIICLPLLSMGIVAYPCKLIVGFLQRPRAPMLKRTFIQTVRQWSADARHIKLAAAKIDNERLLTGTTWQMRWELRALGRQVAQLEMQEAATTQLYPQATDDPELTWTFFVIGTYLRGAWSIIALLLSLAWILNAILFVIPEPPVSLWLNSTVSFSAGTGFLNYLRNISDLIFTQILTFYVLKCVVVGLETWQQMVHILELHPYLRNGTRMTSMFHNAWPLMVSSPAIVDFVATGLSSAMARTTVLSGISSQVNHIRFLQVSLTQNAFSYTFLIFFAFSMVVVPLREYYSRRPERYRPALKGLHNYTTGKAGVAALASLGSVTKPGGLAGPSRARTQLAGPAGVSY